MKICKFCSKTINTKEERYVHVEDWDREKMISDLWSHLSCFNKAMNRDLTELEKQAMLMLKRAGPLLNQLTPELKQEYEIK